jgi:Protein of unknown function (DUF1553)
MMHCQPKGLAALLNDPAYVEAAQHLARRILEFDVDDPAQRAAYAFRRVLARPPWDEEVQRLVSLFESERSIYTKDKTAAEALTASQVGAPNQALNASELAAWTVVSKVLLNLDETLTK